MTTAVIFDMDGVLIDSYQSHFESWRALAAEESRTYTEEQFAAGFGRTSREVIADQWRGEELSEERIARLADRKEAIFRERLATEFPAMEGAVELIAALHEAGVRIGVGSSGPPENVWLILQRLGVGEGIAAVVTGADVTRGKPDPQVFQLVAERLGVPAERCIVVEDAPAGITAARAAGMKCLGLASTGRTRDELQAADLVVGSLRELSVERITALVDELPA
ncbi:MAG: HAD family phosphatase [Planctomycetes bacterium]|nr:HAD family phosphatase [Planctomycetota bacterium]